MNDSPGEIAVTTLVINVRGALCNTKMPLVEIPAKNLSHEFFGETLEKCIKLLETIELKIVA